MSGRNVKLIWSSIWKLDMKGSYTTRSLCRFIMDPGCSDQHVWLIFGTQNYHWRSKYSSGWCTMIDFRQRFSWNAGKMIFLLAGLSWVVWKARNDWVFSNVLIWNPNVLAYRVVGFLARWSRRRTRKQGSSWCLDGDADGGAPDAVMFFWRGGSLLVFLVFRFVLPCKSVVESVGCLFFFQVLRQLLPSFLCCGVTLCDFL